MEIFDVPRADLVPPTPQSTSDAPVTASIGPYRTALQSVRTMLETANAVFGNHVITGFKVRNHVTDPSLVYVHSGVAYICAADASPSGASRARRIERTAVCVPAPSVGNAYVLVAKQAFPTLVALSAPVPVPRLDAAALNDSDLVDAVPLAYVFRKSSGETIIRDCRPTPPGRPRVKFYPGTAITAAGTVWLTESQAVTGTIPSFDVQAFVVRADEALRVVITGCLMPTTFFAQPNDIKGDIVVNLFPTLANVQDLTQAHAESSLLGRGALFQQRRLRHWGAAAELGPTGFNAAVTYGGALFPFSIEVLCIPLGPLPNVFDLSGVAIQVSGFGPGAAIRNVTMLAEVVPVRSVDMQNLQPWANLAEYQPPAPAIPSLPDPVTVGVGRQ